MLPGIDAFSQGVLGDTMNTGSASYVLFHLGKNFKSYTARIEHDSLLVIYDSTGARMNFEVKQWMLSVYPDSAYIEHRIKGKVIPTSVVARMNELDKGDWICIEAIICTTADGRELRINGEKWVRL